MSLKKFLEAFKAGRKLHRRGQGIPSFPKLLCPKRFKLVFGTVNNKEFWDLSPRGSWYEKRRSQLYTGAAFARNMPFFFIRTLYKLQWLWQLLEISTDVFWERKQSLITFFFFFFFSLSEDATVCIRESSTGFRNVESLYDTKTSSRCLVYRHSTRHSTIVCLF